MLGESLSEILQAQGAEVNWHKNAERVMSCLQTSSYDLMILDIGLPKISGFELLAQLREMQQDLPVLILSARDMIQDRVYGLDLGADDYVLKPFDLSELLARVRVLIRRRCGRAQSKIKVGEVCLDPNAHQVFYLGQLVNLSRQEYRLLKLLMENIGGVITRDRLETALLDKEELESNALEVHIHHLRKKIFPEFIRTIRGVGYIVQVEI
jgi:two-component system OmpR family response regulator/two-component system response regulator QseB